MAPIQVGLEAEVWFFWLIAVAWGAAPVTWDTVTEEAISAYGSGPGRAARLRLEGAGDARASVPVGPVAVRAEAQVGLAEQQQVLSAVEIPLGLGTRQRRLWASLTDARRADLDADRWHWVQEVQVAWLDWWTATEIRDHLEEYAADVDDDLVGFEQAVQEGLLAPIALEDLRAESLQVQAELAAMDQHVQVAAARMTTLLGERSLEAGDHDLHDADPDAANPWLGLAERASQLPAVRQAEATADSERYRARALSAARLPTMELGPMWAPDASGRLTALGFVGVRLPLQPGIGPERKQALAGAAAAVAERDWLTKQTAGQLREEAVAWEATRARLLRVERDVLGPLTRRQERLEQALAEGLVTADRVVRARRERHDAEHEEVLVAGALLASEARAELVRQLLRGGE